MSIAAILVSAACCGSLIHYWPFDKDADDVVGGLTSEVFGAELVPGKIGMGYQFDGINEYINSTYIPQITDDGDFSIALWAKLPANVPSNPADLFGLEQSFGGQIRLFMEVNGNIFWSLRDDSGNNSDAVLNQNLSDGDWHHFAVTREGQSNVHSLYLDGQLVAVAQGAGGNINISQNRSLYFAADNHVNGIVSFFEGILDDIRIYDHELTECEVAQLAVGDCTADINNSGSVDVFDLLEVLNQWGACNP